MFKVGDRVRYTGAYHENTPGYVGRVGVVIRHQVGLINVDIEWEDKSEKWRRAGVFPKNLELLRTLSPLEQDLTAYIEREKRELGI